MTRSMTGTKDERIARCMRENLSGLLATDEMCAQIRGRVYGRKAAKGRSGYRPLRIAAAFALALTLLAATATAAVTAWRAYAMRAQQMEEKTGAFASWTLADKLETVKQLAEAGLLDGDERAARLMDGDATDAEAHALADEIVAQTLGVSKATLSRRLKRACELLRCEWEGGSDG